MTQLLTPGQVQAALSLGRTRVYEMLLRGELPVVRIGRAVRVPADALATWVREHTEPAIENGRSVRP